MEMIYSALIGYVFGCINFAYITGKLYGIDIRDKGSHNAGASNVTITLGWLPGVLTALCDIAKAYLAFVVCERLFGGEICPFLGGAFAVIGHIFPFYMKFKGGKGFASYAGMCLGISWKLFLAIVVISALITLITDYIALATLATVVYVPAWLYYISKPLAVVLLLVALGVLIFWKHRVNIRNIRNGTEIGLRKRNKNPA